MSDERLPHAKPFTALFVTLTLASSTIVHDAVASASACEARRERRSRP